MVPPTPTPTLTLALPPIPDRTLASIPGRAQIPDLALSLAVVAWVPPAVRPAAAPTQDPATPTPPPAPALALALGLGLTLATVQPAAAPTPDPAAPTPATPSQALPLALAAAADPHARWQVILTGPDGRAIAAETVRRRYRPDRVRRPTGLTSQVTVAIPAAGLSASPSNDGSGIRTAVL